MKPHLGEVFDGRISSVTEFGFYVTLPNTVEGLVHIRFLPEGEYDY
ncbi:MAG: S1 RNA-binding domain-containing protein [Ruminococcus sp.]|nr:S1 RNA-binding domain-containing protein [Ruminococcus sp.]